MPDGLTQSTEHPLESENRRLTEELERTRAMLVQSAKLAELGRQVAQLVHEVNQPLMGIKAFAQMLQKHLGEDDKALRKAQFIEEQALVLERLVGRVRRFARTSELGAGGTTELKTAMETARALLSAALRRARCDLQVDIPEDLPAIGISDVHAQQLLVNLLSNAGHAIEDRPERRIRVVARPRGPEVIIYVGDTGRGIPEQHRERIFEPFYTTKDADQGTGLGLPICMEIARAYGGAIAAFGDAAAEERAGPGMRTVMEVRLPAAGEAPRTDGG